MFPLYIDGSTLTADDTPANQNSFPQHSMQNEGSGFQIIRFVLIQSLLTGMIFNAAYSAFKGKGTGEMSLACRLFPCLPENALLLGDCYFSSFFVLAYLISQGIHGVFPAHAARDIDFRKGRKLGARDHIVEWDKPQKPKWMSQDEYDNFPEVISIREVNVSHEMHIKEEFVIITTLLDHTRFTKKILSKFYQKRWRLEMAIKDLKDTFGMAHISAKSPEMIQKVFWSYLLAYNMLRWHILNAAILYETSIEKVSVSMRPGRSEPRAVKRRSKSFPRLHEKRSDWHARRNP